MPLIKPILRRIFLTLHILFMYIIPTLFFGILMLQNKPLFFAETDIELGGKAQFLLVVLSNFFVGLLFYIGYLKMKQSESKDSKRII